MVEPAKKWLIPTLKTGIKMYRLLVLLRQALEKEKRLESRTTLEHNPTICHLCETVFEVLPVNMKEIEFANGELIKVCTKCFNRIEVRLPYKVAMN